MHGNAVNDNFHYKTEWEIKKYISDEAFENDNPFEIAKIDGNLLLNEGITELLKLLGGVTATAFDNTNAYIGVGDSTTAESASQTDLQASTNKTYKAMAATYPQVSAQTITFQSVFGTSDANYAWQEFTVANGSSGTAKNLNRKVSNQGTKVSGQTWTVQLTITLS